MWFSYGIAAIAPFSHRLTFDNLPMDIQRLRCKVNFQALVFVPHIRALGDALISRLRNPSGKSGAVGTNYLQEMPDVKDKQGAGKFVVLHLRFDKVCSSPITDAQTFEASVILFFIFPKNLFVSSLQATENFGIIGIRNCLMYTSNV